MTWSFGWLFCQSMMSKSLIINKDIQMWGLIHLSDAKQSILFSRHKSCSTTQRVHSVDIEDEYHFSQNPCQQSFHRSPHSLQEENLLRPNFIFIMLHYWIETSVRCGKTLQANLNQFGLKTQLDILTKCSGYLGHTTLFCCFGQVTSNNMLHTEHISVWTWLYGGELTPIPLWSHVVQNK